MKTKPFILILICLLVTLSLTNVNALASCGSYSDKAGMIVSTDWLNSHLKDSSLVIIHIGDKKEYDEGHIPGAQFLKYSDDISTPRDETALSLELPSTEKLKAAFEKLGVSDNSQIVLYFGKDWISPTTRVYFTLAYLGMGERTSILDGGLPAWREAGKPVTTDVKTPVQGKFNPKLNKDVVADVEWVQANLKNSSIAIIDARNTEFYDGTKPGSNQRSGHILNAENIPFSSLVEEKTLKFKDKETLRKMFKEAKVESGDTITSYCHIGQQATVVFFVARYLGYKVRMYDGSFQDWSKRDLPIVNPKENK